RNELQGRSEAVSVEFVSCSRAAFGFPKRATGWQCGERVHGVSWWTESATCGDFHFALREVRKTAGQGAMLRCSERTIVAVQCWSFFPPISARTVRLICLSSQCCHRNLPAASAPPSPLDGVRTGEVHILQSRANKWKNNPLHQPCH